MKLRELHELLGRELNGDWGALQGTLGEIDMLLSHVTEKLVVDGINGATPLDNLQVLQSCAGWPVEGDPKGEYNTYPFGADMNTVYPRLLAVCDDKAPLRAALNHIQSQSRKMAVLPGEKTVFLLTDKWNAATFRDYEVEFLNHAIRDNIWYVFLLVTDYGITRIPFLPGNRKSFLYSGIRGAEADVSFMEMVDYLHDEPMTYHIDAGTLSQFDVTEYLFDTCRMVCRKHHLLEGTSRCEISENALNRFLQSAAWLYGENLQLEPKEMPFVCDRGHHQLQIFDQTIDFDLSYTDKSGSYSDDRVAMLVEKLKNELDVLIRSCEKRPLSC